MQHTDIVTKQKYRKGAYKMKCNLTSEGKRDIEVYSSHPSQGFKDIQKSQRSQSKKKTKPQKPLKTKIQKKKKKKAHINNS